MTTLQGIINKGVVNAEVQFERLGYISGNLSNYSTNGYRSVRFEQVLNENGYLTGIERTDYTPGAIQRTTRPFDLAIDGTGFIPVTSPSGEVAYTRDGSLRVDKDGYLVTNDGYLIGDGIQLPANYDNLVINRNGEVEIFSNDGTKKEKLGTIPLVNFVNPEGLKKGDGNKVYLTKESGEPILQKNHQRFRQGSVEMTNIDVVGEINAMLRLNASMLASFEVIKAVNKMYNSLGDLNQ